MGFGKVILVDKNDMPIGVMDKLEAHEKGALHRAFSIFLFNYRGEMLLQKRATEKYHCGGLWSNTCCSHPQPDEKISDNMTQKLMQEMGISAPLQKAFTFLYRSEMANGLIEHELDHIYTGIYTGASSVNPEEVEAWSYCSIEKIGLELQRNPEQFTPWFRLLFDPVVNHIQNLKRA